ncbi:hypothetical protein O0L34_g15844 [Tuta absoluta]|nr:hypothetical protein O0L34_g15844 [Tuta absoluta]
MRRLINLFISVTEKVFIPDKGGFIGHWGNQVDNEEKHEYAQACENMKICRSKYTFSSFLADIVAILLKVNNEKLKQATDAITEVLNNIELSDVLDKNMQTKIPKYIEAIEKSDPDKIKIVLSMFRNMLVNKNKPLVVRQSVQRSVINQTVSLMDLIDLLDAKILATDDNVSKWNDLKNRLTQWANGQGSEILEIMQDLVNIVVEGVKKMHKEKSRKFYDKLQMFLRSASSTYQVDHTNPARNATVWKSEI